MKITALKCTVLGNNIVLRIATDEGISGYAQAETSKTAYLKPHVMFYQDMILGEDPRDVERVMTRIRRLGAFKPWGAAVSSIEMALWDIAGQAAGVPVYRLLGGKVRDRVCVYNGSIRFSMDGRIDPQAHADNMQKMIDRPENFCFVKQGVAFHSNMPRSVDGFSFQESQPGGHHPHRGLMTAKGFSHLMACIEAMREVCGDEVGLALDCGPGMVVPDALKLARACEDLDVMWLEDMITGDYTPYVQADLYREVTQSTTTKIHTGEQIYLRQNFTDLIEKRAVDVIGPDPADIGGIAELKWVAEYADLHGILMAPHGTGDGLLGLAALVQVCATLPSNYVAFEYPTGNPEWWYDIVEGLPDPIVVDSHIEVWDRPGIGVTFRVDAAKKYLPEGDEDFFD